MEKNAVTQVSTAIASKKYLVLSSPRSGSSMLCRSLGATGSAGVPSEYFHKRTLNEASNPETKAGELKRYFDNVVSQNCSANGVFGMKLHYNQFEYLFGTQSQGIEIGMQFLRQFQKFILIYRRDKILQAISEVLAMERQLWNSDSNEVRESVGRTFIGSDIVKISRIMGRQISEEYSWRNLMGQLGVNAHEIAYEDLVATPESELSRIKDYLEIAELRTLDFSDSTVKLTNTEKTLEMKRQYLRAIGAA